MANDLPWQKECNSTLDLRAAQNFDAGYASVNKMPLGRAQLDWYPDLKSPIQVRVRECRNHNTAASGDLKSIFDFGKKSQNVVAWMAQFAASTLLLLIGGSVSQAVLKTNRGARVRIFIKYGTVLPGSAFAVSRSSQPKPFWIMSSSSESSRFESR